MSNQHKKDPGAGKPKFRKNWKSWQEDASRVKDRPGYKAKIAKIFNHSCELCGGEKLAQIYVHTKECPNHPDNVAEFERQLEERLDAGMGPPNTKPLEPVCGECYKCGEVKADAQYRTNPFEEEIHNDLTKHWICDDCWNTENDEV